MSKCIGCGVSLQTSNKDMLGYTTNIDKDLCERCFRIRNYNEYNFITKNNQDYIDILKNINCNDLVVLVIDLFNISNFIMDISKYINNKILLVLTKRDILPKSCYDKKLIDYFKNYNLNIIETVVVSSTKNYNLDLLFKKINDFKTSKNVYVVGFTNSGKSTLINKIIYNYSNFDTVITTSNLPSTTIDCIKVKINDNLTLIDTPGLIDSGDIINFVDVKTLKKIIPNKEIKPKTYQIKNKQSIIIEDLIRLDFNTKNNITIYMSNNLNVERIYKDTNKLKEFKKYELDIKNNSDIVIQGLGFIKFTNKSKIVLYAKAGSIYIRKSLI